MQIVQPRLPYSYSALEPYVSRSTLQLHYGKHHRAYVEKTRTLAKQLRLADKPLERIIALTAGQDRHRALFRNAAQAWNHAFYWNSMRPGGGTPGREIARRIDADFGSYKSFAEQFATAATQQFGSGWAWLVLDGDALRITQTSNADTPLAHGQTPLLTIDVWEHAYYPDYQNRRADYIAAVIGHLVNWDFANRNLSRSVAAADAEPLVEHARAGFGR